MATHSSVLIDCLLSCPRTPEYCTVCLTVLQWDWSLPGSTLTFCTLRRTMMEGNTSLLVSAIGSSALWYTAVTDLHSCPCSNRIWLSISWRPQPCARTELPQWNSVLPLRKVSFRVSVENVNTTSFVVHLCTTWYGFYVLSYFFN